MVHILHGEVLRDGIVPAEQVAARLVGQLCTGLCDELIYHVLFDGHSLLVLVFEVTSSLLVVNEVVDGRVRPADGAGVAMSDRHGTELHGLGVEGEKTVGQQLSYSGEILECLRRLDGAEHAGDGAEHPSLRAGGHSAWRRRFLEHTAVAGGAGQMGERLTVEPKDPTMLEGLSGHHAGVVDQEFHGEIVRTVHHEVIFFDDVEGV